MSAISYLYREIADARMNVKTRLCTATEHNIIHEYIIRR